MPSNLNSPCLGVAYQLTENDPLVDPTQCQLDAKQMQDLGANTIRVYHVDPSGDHAGCMSAFSDAGIYLFVDLDTFTTQINPVGIGRYFSLAYLLTLVEQSPPSWNQTQQSAFEAVLDEFQVNHTWAA